MVLVGSLILASVLGGAAAFAGSRPLVATGPGEIAGTTASAAFTIDGATTRQVRYVDRATLSYSFTLTNPGPVPVWVDGLRPEVRRSTLLRLQGIRPTTLRLGPHGESRVTLRMLMTDCERLSARAASLLETVPLRVRIAGLVPRDVELTLPERLRLGSAREASCPRATSKTRPPG